MDLDGFYIATSTLGHQMTDAVALEDFNRLSLLEGESSA